MVEITRSSSTFGRDWPREFPRCPIRIMAVLGFLFYLPLLSAQSRFGDDGGGSLLGPDAFGYTLLDQNADECPFFFVDISELGTALTFTAGGMEHPDDEGGVLIDLGLPFEFYGRAVNRVVMSTNGYLAMASALDQEDGGDFSNDCDLPAIPGNGAGVSERFLVFHDDLSGETTAGRADYAFFPICPRVSANGEDQPCSVFQWSDWASHQGVASFDFQVLLYHHSFEISYQLQPGIMAADGDATIGIQDREARSFLQYGCNQAVAAVEGTAICFFEPRSPARLRQADLEISMTNDVNFALPGQELVYQIEVSNHSPFEVSRIIVSDLLPPTLIDAQWTCSAARGSRCGAQSGAGNLLESGVLLQPGGWVRYVLTCRVDPTATLAIRNSASVGFAGAFADPDISNNQVMDQDALVSQTFLNQLQQWPDPVTLSQLICLVDCVGQM